MSFFNKLSIQSKLMLMVLLTSILSITLIGYIGYTSGRENLTQTVFNQLTSLRAAKASELQAYFDTLEDEALSISESPLTTNALKAFKPAYFALNTTEITPAQNQRIEKYYRESFIPELSLGMGGKPLPEAYYPQTTAQRYLQYHYIAANPDLTVDPSLLVNPRDGSDYSAVHVQYHSVFKNFTEKLGFDDVYLIDADTGEVIYSVAKTPDFATNLESGPYASTILAEAFHSVLKQRDPSFSETFDFQFYAPTLGRPASFIATSIFDGSQLAGVLVFQLSIDDLNAMMTTQESWEKIGLGRTGETYLVGEDFLLRSIARPYAESPSGYIDTLRALGTPESTMEQVIRLKTPVLTQAVETVGAQRALDLQEGIDIYPNYLGVDVLGSYQAMGDNGVWAVLSEINAAEAFEPVQRFTRRLMVTAAFLIPLVTLLASQLVRGFMRPIKKLVAGTEELKAGNTDIQVNLHTQDEFGELADAFNQMAQALHVKEQALQGKIEENERLLLNVLPPVVVDRLRRGEVIEPDTYNSLTVLYAEMEGLNYLPDKRIVPCFHELVQIFDDITDQYGVEKVKALGGTYVAVCGLSEQRVDHTKRTVDFALALLNAIRRYSQQQQVDLSLDIGIDTGPVVAGIVGKSKFSYDLLGDTVRTARAIHSSPKQNVIQVTPAVRDNIEGIFELEAGPEISVKGLGKMTIWEVTARSLSPITKD